MTTEKLIQFLRSSVHIQDPDTDNDSKYLSMTDEDLELYLTVALSRDFASVRSLDALPKASVYPLLLLAKKELYYALAVIEAPLYDMTADSNNQLKRDQRFQHYMKLIAQVDEEYNTYNSENETGTHNTLTTYDVLLSNRYFTPRYRNKSTVPVVSLFADNVTTNSVDLSWERIVNNFAEFRVYISKEPIYDPYNLKQPVSEDAKLVFKVRSDTQHMCRITDLEENTVYYILIVYYDKSGLKGYSQISIDTSSVTEPEIPEIENPTDDIPVDEGDGGE